MFDGILYFMVPFITGMVLAILNYVSLWLTVQNVNTVKHPAFLIILSFILRMGIIMVGFYLVMAGRWERLMLCLAGFLLIRYFLIRNFQAEQKHTGLL